MKVLTSCKFLTFNEKVAICNYSFVYIDDKINNNRKYAFRENDPSPAKININLSEFPGNGNMAMEYYASS